MAKLAAEEPEVCDLATVGWSRAGEPLEMLTVRGGPMAVLVMAGPHPNEPVGGATVLALAGYLLERPEVREDVTWHLLLSADPDGGRLNEGWTSKWPVSLEEYHLRLYRPEVHAQPECTFPVDGFDGQLPETRAIMSVVDELRPALSLALHNADTGGCFFMVSRPDEGLVDVLAEAAEVHGLPLDEMPSDCVGLESPGAGVFVMPEPPAVADRKPAAAGEWQPAGGSSLHYVARRGGLGISVEAPMWRTTPLSLSAEDSVVCLLDAARELDDVLERLPQRESVFRSAVGEQVAIMRLMAQITRGNPEGGAGQDLTLLVPLRGAGMLLRHVDELLADEGAEPGLFRERELLEGKFTLWSERAERALRPEPIPLSQMVGYQVDVALGVARMLLA
ncbi:M14 family zinc carboxypeptidase [Streptomyces sp. CFMR 7]|uniref:M14 family zinc carboxypeptidase n=1 Tax=Streptomyces sp. CFMR 7 TaxID=1649184 RepID=UPI0021B5D478|nr:M14 family zinc carboxypeptidase [Streptomyces sp. CFMR 7]